MELRNVGRSGLRVSTIGLGCNNFGGRIDMEASRAVIHAALDAGITLFDTADIYGNRGGSEEALGQFLGERRKEIVLATKFGMAMDDVDVKIGAARRYIVSALENSLRRLKTDWVDLYQVHKPDPRTPIEETMRALDDLIRAGKVRYIGCSNFPAWQMADAQWTARLGGLTGFVSCQDEYSLVVRGAEQELIPCAQAHGLGLLPYFPLASGLLTGKYKPGQMPAGSRFDKNPNLADRYLTEANRAIAAKLDAFATERGHSLLELAFSWLLAHPVVPSVIAGATKPEQIAANVAAGGWRLGPEDLAEIDRICGRTPTA